MHQHLRNPATRVAASAVAVGASLGFALGLAGTSPRPVDLASSSAAAGDVSGPCDEAEHAADPRCATMTTPMDLGRASSSSTSSTSTTSTTSPASTPTSGPLTTSTTPGLPSGSQLTVDAAGAGTVVYVASGSSLRLVSATPSPGWRVEIERAEGIEIDLDFRSGSRRVQVDIEFEDGAVRERVRFRDDADDTRVETTNGVITDERRDDDRSGRSGSDHDRDDDDRDDDDRDDDDRDDDDRDDD